MRMMELLGHLAFALIALSFLVRDILWLRALSIVASLASIGYGYFGAPEPLWVIIGWNALFIAVNVTQIVLYAREKRGVSFSDEEREVWETSFSRFSGVEFMRLLRIASWRNVEPKVVLTRTAELCDEVLLIYSGRAGVDKNGRRIAELRAGDFVGEMSFITGLPSAATVTTLEPTRCLVWPKNDLRSLLDRNPAMRVSLQAQLGEDMARKLGRRTGLTGVFQPPAV